VSRDAGITLDQRTPPDAAKANLGKVRSRYWKVYPFPSPFSSSESGRMTRVDWISVTVTTPGSGSSIRSTISVSTCGAGAGTRFLLRGRAFAVAGRALRTSLVPAFLADLFAFLETGRFAGLLLDVFRAFPRLDALWPIRLFRLAIASPHETLA
jgi:hypothetical protein